jgi:hypothetical protein
MNKCLHMKYQFILSHFTATRIFWTHFRKKKKYIKIKNFMKIRPVGADVLHADELTDGQTDIITL